MAKFTVDGKDYDSENLSDEGKATLNSLQFVQSEMNRLQNLLAVHKTASAAYAQRLQSELND